MDTGSFKGVKSEGAGTHQPTPSSAEDPTKGYCYTSTDPKGLCGFEMSGNLPILQWDGMRFKMFRTRLEILAV